MGEPITRLNPIVESRIQGILFEKALGFLSSVAMIFPKSNTINRGPKPYDYRIILVLCIFRILLRKTYADYEIEMRTDLRICRILNLKILSGKSTIQRGMKKFSMDLLREFNQILI